ncbi:MAG TPA: MobF family relaxase, partial [Phenylobacterium sp.]
MMTPSRIRSAAGAANYYGKDDYYVTGEAGAPGIAWGGRGGEALGLSGTAVAADFQSVLAGPNPAPAGPPLSGAGAKARHHPGWDFTFTVPKSVSLAIVAAERHDPELAARLQEHVMAANAAMMGHLEANHAFTRVRGPGGAIREVQTGNLVYASVLHRTTRGGDPHFHVHNPTANTTRNPETGTWGALETKHIYRWQQLASQVGARELQARLMAEGFDLVRHGELKWEIAGVDPSLLAAFSRRTAEIDDAGAALATARKLDRLTPAQRDMVQKQTRKAKAPVDRDRLAEDWGARAAAVDHDALERLLSRGAEPGRDVSPTLVGRMGASLHALTLGLRALTGGTQQTDAFAAAPGRDPDPEARRLAAFGVKVVEAGSAVASRYGALLQAARITPTGLRVDRLEAAMDRLTRDGHVLPADQAMPGGITTRRMVEVERAIVGAVAAGRGAARPILSQAAADRALQAASTSDTLNAGQRAAVVWLLTSADRIRAVPGFAGVGKTFAFATVAEIATRSGQRLHGLSSVNTHVQQLRDGAGIPA